MAEPRISPLAWLRSRLKDRPDTEHEQALVRLVIAVVLGAYLLVPHATRESTGEALQSLLVFGAWALMALAIFCAILVHPGMSPVRRTIGAIGDCAAISYFMIQTGVDGLLFVLVYVWIIFGNGVRYGKRYLIQTLVLSVIGFSLVLMFSDFWHAHVGAGASLILGMIGISLYVLTLVKRLEKERDRADATIIAGRRLVRMVSQEMRTPLNIIFGTTELLRDTPPGREQSEMVRTIGASSREMLGLVDVLDLSWLDAGTFSVAKEDFDLYALVNDAKLVPRPQAERKGLSLVVSIMPDVPRYVRGVPAYLRQVLVKLLGSAVKFTEKGGVTLNVSRVSADRGAARLKFAIRDTGIGIDPSPQRRIFESFTQADQGVTRKFGGTGLDTMISKRLVELMGGQIELESAAGVGTTFWFELEFETVERALDGSKQ